jgi:hypothetical protein
MKIKKIEFNHSFGTKEIRSNIPEVLLPDKRDNEIQFF